MSILLAAVGCGTPGFNPGQARIVSVHGQVQQWDGKAWAAAGPDQAINNGAKLHADAGSYADLSVGDSLTIHPAAVRDVDAGDAAPQNKDEPATQTVLEVTRGCVLVSVGKLSPDSVFQIRGGGVVAQVHEADFSINADGTVATVSGKVSVTAGEKSSVLRELGELDAQKKQLAAERAQDNGPRLVVRAPGSSPSGSPFDTGLETARRAWY